MCFGSKESREAGDAPARPVPLSQTANGVSNDNKRSSYNNAPPSKPLQHQAQQRDIYAPPPGPPPSHSARPVASSSDDYAPPPGPPPGQASRPAATSSNDDYAPPPGPPPSYGGSVGAGPSSTNGAGDYAPPPGPPPGKSEQPQQKVHDWETAVPDNSLLPPPPNLFAGWDRSPANNATEDEAEQGKAWCYQHPINTAMNVQNNAATYEAIKHFNFNLQVPSTYQGKFDRKSFGVWAGETKKRSADSCIVSFPPLYAANLHSPAPGGQPFTAYYEVHIARDNRKEVSLAMGFVAMPYPHFRLPGWHRGSLAVHGDDGHRYVNDTWGGKELIDDNYRLKPGGKYGIGMTFTRKDGAGYGPAPDTIDVEVFFTDNGRIVASWDLHEEIDAEQDLPVTGLEGDYDLSAAIGTFDVVKFDVHLNPENWAYQEMKNKKLVEMRS
ncbi:hypothetical protein SBRCBS47491_002475 [Sporothrix bragantina]|uniref:SPRY domain-containing protein n=1 Tax=Sporothrix bragantina TaxID=671064 RepID=A0ABP0B741_9PEZI